MDIWKVSDNSLTLVNKSRLDSEEKLENWIANDSSILGIDLLVIGRQITSEYGGRIDLLGITLEGDLVIIELKKDRTPRDIVAQVLDYATWVKSLTYSDADRIAREYKNKPLAELFSDYYKASIPESINANHSMLIVASELDESSERILEYLADEYKININAIFFNFFKDGDNEYLGRAWLLDPEDVQSQSESRKLRPWSGYWFVNVGEGPERNWEDNTKYGYIGAGQGIKYSRPLKNLSKGDKIFAYMKGFGYVGYGEVEKEAVMIKDFIVKEINKPLLELPLKAPSPAENSDNPELSEWAVGIKWLKTVPREKAKSFKGVFANQNIVCKLRHQETADFLKREFEVKTI
jgi:hypothetical protein